MSKLSVAQYAALEDLAYRPAVLDAEGVINGVVQHTATTNRILRALADAGILLVREV